MANLSIRTTWDDAGYELEGLDLKAITMFDLLSDLKEIVPSEYAKNEISRLTHICHKCIFKQPGLGCTKGILLKTNLLYAITPSGIRMHSSNYSSTLYDLGYKDHDMIRICVDTHFCKEHYIRMCCDARKAIRFHQIGKESSIFCYPSEDIVDNIDMTATLKEAFDKWYRKRGLDPNKKSNYFFIIGGVLYDSDSSIALSNTDIEYGDIVQIVMSHKIINPSNHPNKSFFKIKRKEL